MNYIKESIVVFFSCMLFLCSAWGFDDGDFQYWNTEGLSLTIDSNWKLLFEEELRFGDDGSNLYYQHSDIGYVYSGFARWLDIGLNYRHIYEEKNSQWHRESRPYFYSTFKHKFDTLSLSNRARFEYRYRQSSDNRWQYRNKFTLKVPLVPSHFSLAPYIADELFFDFDEGTLNRNRFYSGIQFKLSRFVTGDIFYLWQSTESQEKWNDTHILGTKLKVPF